MWNRIQKFETRQIGAERHILVAIHLMRSVYGTALIKSGRHQTFFNATKRRINIVIQNPSAYADILCGEMSNIIDSNTQHNSKNEN